MSESRSDDERILTFSRHPVEQTASRTPEELREDEQKKFEDAKRRSYLRILRSIKRTGWWWP